MPTSKKRKGSKGHQKKVNNRNSLIKDNKRKVEKFQQEQFEDLLKQFEKQQQQQQDPKEEDPNIDQIAGIDGPEI